MPDAIAGVLGTQQQFGLHSSVDSAMSALGGMDSEGFLNLLVAQLKYQDPMKPSDPGDMMTQTATLAQLDANQQLLQIQQRNFGMQQAVQASSMLGTEVTGVGASGDPVSGVVEAIRYTELGPMLRVAGEELALGTITEQRYVLPEVPEDESLADGGVPEVWDGPLRADEPTAVPEADPVAEGDAPEAGEGSVPDADPTASEPEPTVPDADPTASEPEPTVPEA